MTEQDYLNSYNEAFKLTSAPSDMGVSTAIDNALLGNYDYQRELAQMQMQNSFNAWQSSLAWERQKESAQSQYQWAVQDMRKAGLNPYLAYSNGGNQVGSVPTASNSGFSSQNKGKQVSSLLGGILSTLLGSAFKVATTSMISESQMALQLERSKTAKELSQVKNMVKSISVDNSLNNIQRERKSSVNTYANRVIKARQKQLDYYNKYKVWKDLDDFM